LNLTSGVCGEKVGPDHFAGERQACRRGIDRGEVVGPCTCDSNSREKQKEEPGYFHDSLETGRTDVTGVTLAVKTSVSTVCSMQ